MYHHIRGRVVELGPTVAVIEANGVGYAATIPLSTCEALRAAGDGEVVLFTHLHVREDQLRLFGFATVEERTCFEQIVSVRGIGPTTAIAILSGLSVEEFSGAIEEGTTRRLERVKGVGRRTAERLILELRGKLPVKAAAPPGPMEEVILALVSLGYSRKDAEDTAEVAVRESPGGSVEEILKLALRRSSPRR